MVLPAAMTAGASAASNSAGSDGGMAADSVRVDSASVWSVDPIWVDKAELLLQQLQHTDEQV
jgi:hypothetical protein